MTTTPPNDAVVVTPSRDIVIVSPRRDPSSAVVRATTIATTELSNVTEAYDAFISTLMPGGIVMNEDAWHAMADGRNFSSSYIRLSRSSRLANLAWSLGCRCVWTQLILHPNMNDFIQRLRSDIRANGSTSVNVGIYRAPSLEKYHALCDLTLQGRVLINPCYIEATKDPDGVRPVVVVYQPPGGFVDASKVVPIGVLGV